MNSRCYYAQRPLKEESKKTISVLCMLLLKSLMRVLSSTMLNIGLFVIGVIAGMGITHIKMQYYASSNSNYGYIEKIEDHIKQLEDMDLEYVKKQEDLLQLLRQLKAKQSIDVETKSLSQESNQK